MLTEYYKKSKKDFYKGLVKGIKVYLNKRKTKSQYARERNRNLSKEEKKRQ